MAAENTSAGWWERNWKTLVILFVFFAISLFIRSYFNYEASYNDGDWRWSGTDPYYHMRVVDHISETGQFLLHDDMINYPVGANNPRPPVFDWLIAAVGGIFALFGADRATSTEAVAAFSPAVWGALTVFPMYALGAAAFGRKAGLWSAFFIAVMAAHVTRTNLGAVDHDGTILFFLVLAAFFFVKALQLMNNRVYVEDYRKGAAVRTGYGSFFRENKASLIYAALTGAAIAGIGLTWQGYPYAFAIMAVWFGFQLLANHLRVRDSTGHFLLVLIPFLVTLAMVWPYYEVVSRVHSQVYPTLYMLAGVLLAALIFVPTRHLPPVLVLPMTIGGIAIGLLLMLVVFPDIGDLFFTGLGYFVQTKLYSTIAEAQRTPLGYLAFATGIVPFFFGLAGLVFALISFVKRKRNDHLFVLVWAAIGLLMAFTATRFVFNASVGFALMAGWMTALFIDYVRFGDVRRSWRNVRSAGYSFYKSTRSSVGARHVFGAIFIVFILLVPTVWGGVDAGVPGEYINQQTRDLDEDSAMRTFWSDYFGAFGQDFLSSNWIDALGYLSERDTQIEDPGERPAFIAWWDYGFYAAQVGKHPTVADPFQFGYQISGRFLASQTESEAIAFMAVRLVEGNLVRGERSGALDSDVASVLDARADGLADRVAQPLRSKDYDGAYAAIVEAIPGEDGASPEQSEIVSLYKDLRDATGDSIRYFALDGRMFPCDDPRSQGIDSGSIFYAPVFLADKNPEDFVRTMYRDGSGQRYFQVVYETTEDGGSRQIETPHVVDSAGNRYLVGGGALFPMNDDGFIDYTNPLSQQGIQLASEELQYQEAFYNTLLYRAWVGPAPASADEKIPPHTEYAPGADLKNFRLVYTTVRTAPDDQGNRCFDGRVGGGYSSGVAILEYFDGAAVEGTVVDSQGQPMENVTVRVTDNFGVPHDTTETGSDGSFQLSAPFSSEEDPSERAATERPNTLRGTGANRIEVVSRGSVVVSQNFSVSQEQAAGRGDPIPPFTLTVELGSLSGVVFEDLDADGVLNETDTRIAGANVQIGSRNTTTDDQGRYSFDGVRPGSVVVQVEANGYQDGSRTVTVPSGASATANVALEPAPVNVTGVLRHEGEAVPGATVKFSPDPENPDAAGARTSTPSDAGGNYTIQLEPGTWYASVDYLNIEDDQSVRYYTEDPVELVVARDDGPITQDLDLQREEL